MENKEFDEIKLEKYKTSIESIIYNSKPNLRYKENIINDFKYSYWIFDNYDIYYKYENKLEVFLVYGKQDNNINIIRLEDKKFIKTLKGHKKLVDLVKSFYNKNDNKNYLLSVDYSKLVILWDLNKYKQIHKINTYYSKSINSFSILFEKNYIITSTEGTNGNTDTTKLYSLINANIIMSINHTSNNETLYLLIWKYNNNYYLIELCYDNIFIYDLSNGKLFKDLTSKYNLITYFYSGFISYDNKYLYTCSNNGYINIWNLYTGTLAFNIKNKAFDFMKITLWSTEIKEKNISKEKEEKKNY